MKLILSAVVILFSVSGFSLTNSQAALSDGWQAAVMMKTEAQDPESGDSLPAYCNGTLVSPQIILTAAHCVVHAEVLKERAVDIQIGKYKYITRPSDGKIVRIGYAVHTKLTENARFLFLPSLMTKMARSGLKTVIAPEEDIAVLYFDQPLSLSGDFPYAKVLPTALLSTVLQKLNSGILSVLTVNFIAEATSDTKRIASLNSVTYDRGGFLVSKSTSRVEEMDSGGAVYSTLNGVNYWTAAVKGRGQNLWSNWDAYTVGVGKVCALAKTAGLSVDSQKILCQ